MSLFNVNMNEIMTFFAVIVRFSVLFSLLPVVGDRMVPAPAKILLALCTSLTLFPVLTSSGIIHTSDAAIWSSTVSGLVGTICLEVFFGLVLGYVSKLIFDAILIGGNLIGNFMGYSTASVYDPHQESQTEVIGHLQSVAAMLLFLSVDGHHVMLRAILDSYQIVGVGQVGFSQALQQELIHMTAEVLHFGIRMASPIAVGIFAVNIIFGIISRTVPQINILVLSFAANALIGFAILWMSLSEFQDGMGGLFSQMNDWMHTTILLLKKGG